RDLDQDERGRVPPSVPSRERAALRIAGRRRAPPGRAAARRAGDRSLGLTRASTAAAHRDDGTTASMASRARATRSWERAPDQLREWDPAWAETCLKMIPNPWTTGVLSRKTVELISVALNAAPTALGPEGTRRYIRAPLEAGATREEILMVAKMASM